jgi:hypothetical protein
MKHGFSTPLTQEPNPFFSIDQEIVQYMEKNWVKSIIIFLNVYLGIFINYTKTSEENLASNNIKNFTKRN